jgi:hypothetical protein
MLRDCFAVVLLVLAVLAHPLHAQQAVIKDATGDPLPPGAFARVGATRFRVPGAVYGARFVDGGKKILLRIQPEPAPFGISENEGTFRLFDAESGLELGQLAIKLNDILAHWGSSGPVADFISFSDWSISPDAKRIGNLEGFRSSKLQVRDLTTGQVVF